MDNELNSCPVCPDGGKPEKLAFIASNETRHEVGKCIVCGFMASIKDWQSRPRTTDEMLVEGKISVINVDGQPLWLANAHRLEGPPFQASSPRAAVEAAWKEVKGETDVQDRR